MPALAKEESDNDCPVRRIVACGQPEANLRDTRYGEVFLIRSEGGELMATVYNTIGLNEGYSKVNLKK